jgi:ribose 5-phosphate isomerase A
MTIYERALAFIADGDNIGLGSGRASAELIKALAGRVRAGLRVRAVPTSRNSEELALSLGVPLVPLEEAMPLALTVDGADEVAPNLDLIKGWGRALVREKIVAASSRRLVILAGLEKVVPVLGTRGKLPIEVLPFALPLCQRRLSDLGLQPVLYQVEGRPFVSDNGNYLLDCGVQPIRDPVGLEMSLRAIPGVVGTGLFLGMADTVLIGDEARQFELVKESTRAAQPRP